MNKAPASQRAEEAVLGSLLRSEEARIEVIGSGLEAEHFHYRPYRAAYEQIVENFYSDEAIDPLSIAEAVGPSAAKSWGIEEREAVDRLTALAALNGSPDEKTTAEHAKIIKRHADYRELLKIASRAVNDAIEQQRGPDEIAGTLSAAATRVITGSMARSELLSYSDLGRRWMRAMQDEIAARAEGTELGAFFGIKGIDDYVKGLRPTELMMLAGDPGSGKHLSLSTKLPTPTGWTTMGQVQPGDTLYDERGLETLVTGVSEVVHGENVYEIKFSDGSTVKASGTHQWVVSSRRTRSRASKQAYKCRQGRRNRPPDPPELETLTTAELAVGARIDGGERANYAVQIAAPLMGTHRDLPLDPYILGCWLAEGDTMRPRVTLGDAEIVDILRARGANISVRDGSGEEGGTRLAVGMKNPTGVAALREVGVLGRKHIPRIYMRASQEQRWALLAGIADGDGWCNGGCEITTVLPALRDDIYELATSLGCAVSVREGRAQLNGCDYGPKWNVGFQSPRCPFWIERKAQGWTPRRLSERHIVAVEPVASEPVKCLAVEASSHLYLCGRAMIPTHNSAVAWRMARGFAKRQMRRPADKRVATLVLSLEMGEQMSSSRFAQIESGVEGELLRTGSMTRTQLAGVASRWAANRELPLILNHSGELRESQIRALCVDGIRRHNVGLVIIDHFRFIKTDERFENKNDADEQIVRFLKATLAKDLNVAVVCLAHTTKSEARRPVMDDLRGSKMISAFADVVSFLYWPWKQATQEQRERGVMAREEYEVIHDKVRQGAPGTGEMWIDMSTMTIR